MPKIHDSKAEAPEILSTNESLSSFCFKYLQGDLSHTGGDKNEF